MKEISKSIEYKDHEYKLCFNLNVMERLQEEYGTLDAWGNLTDGKHNNGEPNIKAVIFGFREMINEGIDISNDENGTKIKPLTLKQVGRMITELGLEEATAKLNDTVIESTKSEEKNELSPTAKKK